MGSLMVLYQIVKCFEYKNTSEREPLVQVWETKFLIFLKIVYGVDSTL